MDRKTFRKEVTLPLRTDIKAKGRTFGSMGRSLLLDGVWVAHSGHVPFDIAYCLGQVAEYRRRRLFETARHALLACRKMRTIWASK